MGTNQSTQNGSQQLTPEMIQQYKQLQQQQLRQQQMNQQQQQNQNNNNNLKNLTTQHRYNLQQQQMQNMILQQQQQAMLNQRQFNMRKQEQLRERYIPNKSKEFQPRLKPQVQTNNEIVSVDSNNFIEEERQRELEFERQEKIRRQKFMEEQRKRRQAFNNEMNTFKNSKFNPYKILSLSKNYTLKQLKKSYKVMAMKTHPDRGGDPRVFKIITKSYMFLLNEYKRKNNSHGYNELQKDSQKWMETQTSGENTAMNMENGKFNINKFNQIYSENRLNSVDDVGYGDWISSSKMDDDYEPENLFSDQFNLNVFNDLFSSSCKTQKQNKIVKYQEPTALNSANQLACIELGRNKISDFTSNNVSAVQSGKKKLHFTDYKKAHTETTFTDKCGNPKRGNFKSIGELKSDRKNIQYKMTPKQRELYERNKRREQRLEKERLHRLESQDRMVFSNYKKINNLILGGDSYSRSEIKQIEYKR